jgi:hypothetical protein
MARQFMSSVPPPLIGLPSGLRLGPPQGSALICRALRLEHLNVRRIIIKLRRRLAVERHDDWLSFSSLSFIMATRY